ncbi:MAG: CPBP family intramembrane metalloprotease [Oscillospiraceae bacterium]|jgi:uncharacterized protein
MNSKIKQTSMLVLAILLEFAVLFGIVLFQKSSFVSLPVADRAVLMIVLQWLLLIVPFVFMKLYKISLSEIGFSKFKLVSQVLIGSILGISMSLIFTVFPIIVGFKDMVGSTSYSQTWQFCYQFIYMIFGVALVEEIFYRGFLFERVLNISKSKWTAIIISSCVFGLSHIFNGSIIQAFTTSLLGVMFCICRDKIKSCTTLSLIIMHGINNALITLFVAILP